jgi:hypothetical protein
LYMQVAKTFITIPFWMRTKTRKYFWIRTKTRKYFFLNKPRLT